MAPWLELLLSPLLLLGLIPGWGAVAWLERRNGGGLEEESRIALAFALAIGWMQLGMTAAGFLGLLRPAAVLLWGALGLALGLAGLRGAPRPGLGSLGALPPLLLVLALATVPPWYRDEMTYHLALPRAFALAGGYVRPDDNVFASFPLGWESVLAGLASLSEDGYGPMNPRLLGAWTMGAAALALAGLARAAGAERGAARLFAACFLLVPTVIEFGASAYVEPWLILLALLMARLALAGRERPGWGAWAGLLAGLAASVKYPGLLVGLLGLGLLPRGPRARFLIAFVLVGSPFYLRNIVERGNPFFPLAWELLGGEDWDAWRSYAYRATLRNYGLGRELHDWVLLLPRLLVARDLREGFEGSIGPLAALGPTLLVLGRRRDEAGAATQRALGLLVLAWLVFWALTVQQVRFALVGLAWAYALGAAVLPTRSLARGAVLALSLLWAAGPARELWARQHTGAWLAGRISRDALLGELLPESYASLCEVNRIVPADGKVWLVWTRAYTYYLDRPYRLDSVFEAWRLEALLDESADLASFHAALRRDGITHLLVNERFFLSGTSADLRDGRTAALRARWQSAIDAGALVATERWGPVALYAVADR